MLRDYGLVHRRLLGERLREICRIKRLLFLVAGDGRLAATLSANGLHLRETQILEIPSWRTRYPNWLITVAAHSRKAVLKAGNAGAHAALISPIFKTDSHPDAKPLGITKLRRLVALSPIPLYALGGLNPKNQAQLTNIGLAGIAGISGFASS